MVIQKKEALSRRLPVRGDEISYAWYPNFVVKEWITTVDNPMGRFHAVLLDDQCMLVDTRRRLPPVWLLENDGEYRIWHDIHQRPVSASQSEFDVDHVICHYESEDGAVYFAVQMSQFESPTWLLDTKESSNRAIQVYCSELIDNFSAAKV